MWGYWSGFGNTSCRTPVNPIPKAPTGISGEVVKLCGVTGGFAVAADWTAVSGATSYVVTFTYYDGWGKGYAYATTVPTNTYGYVVDGAATGGQPIPVQAYVSIKAVNSAGSSTSSSSTTLGRNTGPCW